MSNEIKGDVESSLLYPWMQERPELRWAFIRKVYSILTVQLLITIAVAAAVAAYHPIAVFFMSWGGLALYVGIIITLVLVMILLVFYGEKHPYNLFLLAIFTLGFGLVIGLASSFVSGIIILEAASATAVVVVSLTVYTFWAAKRGQDFSFLRPFLLSSVVILTLHIIFLIWFNPGGKFSQIIYSALAVLIFSAYIIYDTKTLIERHTYDQYILASIYLYLDVIRLFVVLLRLLEAAKKR